MNTDLRLFAVWEDDPLEAPLAADVRVNEEACIVGQWPIFGAIALGTEAQKPFVLFADGTIDFGASAGDRYWRTDLRTIAVRRDAVFRIIWPGGDEGAYRIEKLARLGGKTVPA